MINEVDSEGVGQIDFPEFLSLMSRKMKETDTQQELQDSLRIFDKNGDGMLNVRELKHLITGLGERMTEEEVEAMLAAAGV